jgi:hypothetical protein
MRFLLGVTLALAICGSSAAQAPQTTGASSPAASAYQPVRLTRTVFRLREGEVWGRWGSIVACKLLSEELKWRAEDSDVKIDRFAAVFDEELSAAGLAPRKTESLFDDQPSSGLQIGVVITGIDAQICSSSNGDESGASRTFRGTASMTAEWQVYDPLRREVIARITTTAAGEEKQMSRDGVERVLLAGFRANARQLAADDVFRRAMAAPDPAAPMAQNPAPGQAPIRLVGAPRGRKSIADASGSVVFVLTASGFGSGALVSSDGYLLTTQHVVGDARTVRVRWSDGFESNGEVVRADKRRDVALIKTEPHGRSPLALNRTLPAAGITVFAIGTPLDPRLQNTVTRGTVSAHRIVNGFSFIQSDVAVTHGNSGGPLLDESGAVVGLTVLGLYPDESKSLNLFIPIGDALDFLNLKPTP